MQEDDIRPLIRALVLVACGVFLGAAAPPPVPLAPWTGGSFPNGLPFGDTMGISFGDYDGDGFIDIFACKSGNLWRNVDGVDWQHVDNFTSVLPPAERRYGASFGDYDNDGLADIVTAPRVPLWGDDQMHLLHNLGGGTSFQDVAGDPSIVDVQAYNNAETVCWADVNGDGNLDLFVPVYPDSVSGPGNFFYLNQGPTGPGGAYRFKESSERVGLDVPPGAPRPEGAQFVDVDGDGDVDLYANGTLYRNVSTADVTRFDALAPASSGIDLGRPYEEMIDEGAVLFDYDLDGDFDLAGSFSYVGIRLFENRGDGTFFEVEPGVLESPLAGLYVGMSAEDWDNDGDIDLTSRHVFRTNMLVEEGHPRFAVAPTSIPLEDRSDATPAWGDWDKDGDLDCALGNYGGNGWLFENTTYSNPTALPEKGYVRVRPVRDSRTISRGLETEFGAIAEVRVLTGSDPFRRRKFVASSHGYLNQNEYTLHFGVPVNAHVAVSVDFPGRPDQGRWRVDRDVNPVLGDIDPAALLDHEITVTRCGEVIVDGVIPRSETARQPAVVDDRSS
jgi:hypothetical protein